MRRGYTDYPGDKFIYGKPYPTCNGTCAEGKYSKKKIQV